VPSIENPRFPLSSDLFVPHRNVGGAAKAAAYAEVLFGILTTGSLTSPWPPGNPLQPYP